MVLSELYKLILTKLAADGTVTHIDLWNGQTEFEEEQNAFNRPAVFFVIENAPFRLLGRKAFEGDCTFNLHLVSDLIQNTDSTEDVDIRNLGLAHLDLISTVIYLMHNLSSEANGIGSILYTGVKQFDSNFAGTIHHVLSFNVSLMDNSAKHTTTKKTVTYTATVSKQ
jgi:hypothetical protein